MIRLIRLVGIVPTEDLSAGVQLGEVAFAGCAGSVGAVGMLVVGRLDLWGSRVRTVASAPCRAGRPG